ncbi:hypothetical protein [Bacillus cereus]|nr:hypothetical protein [Bacillus cereus]
MNIHIFQMKGKYNMKNTINDALNLENILLPKNQMQWYQDALKSF